MWSEFPLWPHAATLGPHHYLPTAPPAQKNAFIFNAPDSLYFKAAKQLSDMFEKKMVELEAEAESVCPLQLDTMERCNLLVADMQRNPLAEWFLDPVDHVGLGLTDYLQVTPPLVQQP